MPLQGNTLLPEALRMLRGRLPPGWAIAPAIPLHGGAAVDTLAELTSKGRRQGLLALEACLHLDPRGVRSLVEARRIAPSPGVPIVVARYLGSSTRAALREAELSYLDLTGNLWVVVSEPGLFIETDGATVDPSRERRPARSLRGKKAGRVIRALVDHQRPPRVRELAHLARVDAGYVSRVLAFLDAEALVTRIGHGQLQNVHWAALLRRLAKDAPLVSRGRVCAFHAPHGMPTLLSSLRQSTNRYLLSGGPAATLTTTLSHPEPAIVWLDAPTQAAALLGLEPTDGYPSVLLVESDDDMVFEGATEYDRLRLAAPSQLAVDLLSFPHRNPTAGEALLAWMEESASRWRRPGGSGGSTPARGTAAQGPRHPPPQEPR